MASPGKLRYSKAARKAAFAECRAAVSEHDSCARVLTKTHSTCKQAALDHTLTEVIRCEFGAIF